MTGKSAPPDSAPPAEPPVPDWKALLGPELRDPHPERAGPAPAAGPGRGRR